MTELTEDDIDNVLCKVLKFATNYYEDSYDVAKLYELKPKILQALSLEKRVREKLENEIESLKHVPTNYTSEIDNRKYIIKELQQLLGDKHE